MYEMREPKVGRGEEMQWGKVVAEEGAKAVIFCVCTGKEGLLSAAAYTYTYLFIHTGI